MKANTLYLVYNDTDTQILWFWEILRNFDEVMLGKFLQFVTGTSKVPPRGFVNLMGQNGPQKLTIGKINASDTSLPSAHTCFNQLDLPPYTSLENMRNKLILAIEEGSEGFGLV